MAEDGEAFGPFSLAIPVLSAFIGALFGHIFAWRRAIGLRARERKRQACENFWAAWRSVLSSHMHYLENVMDERIAQLHVKVDLCSGSTDTLEYFQNAAIQLLVLKEQVRLRTSDTLERLKEAESAIRRAFPEQTELVRREFGDGPRSLSLPAELHRWPDDERDQLTRLESNEGRQAVRDEFNKTVQRELVGPCLRIENVLRHLAYPAQVPLKRKALLAARDFAERMRTPVELRRISRGAISRGKGVLASLIEARVFVNRDELGLFCREHHIRRMALVPQARAKKLAPKGHFVALVAFDRDHTPGLVGLGKMSERFCDVLGVRRAFLMTEEELPPERRAEVLRTAEVLYEGP